MIEYSDILQGFGKRKLHQYEKKKVVKHKTNSAIRILISDWFVPMSLKRQKLHISSAIWY